MLKVIRVVFHDPVDHCLDLVAIASTSSGLHFLFSSLIYCCLMLWLDFDVASNDGNISCVSVVNMTASSIALLVGWHFCEKCEFAQIESCPK